ncbi:MAG: triose-phosphate isomerase [Flavobacteriales bacterium]
MKKIIAGNWKMHKDRAEAITLIDGILRESGDLPKGVGMVVAPAFPFLADAVARTQNTPLRVGAQNVHGATHGAYTGEVSAGMLASIGVQYCIVGHSERRQYWNETDNEVAKKIAALLKAGITPIFCCGERKEERLAERHFEVVGAQMKEALGAFTAVELQRIVVAYEPVWAIGTGLNATAQQAQDMHAHIRGLLRTHGDAVSDNVPILYGGSCKPDNAGELFACPDVNGGLIGGAALEVASFTALVRIAGQ